ncbi:Uncharacterised protein [Mycobacteroides abscessus subsp. bolletii]|uniref:hypothetical protein n=1 Tax=Mycobacteroides abscessus TaxID=36809 RepID=UPI000928FA11|nr:hypothetical protein [Mycobacteroides abscessus]SIJ05608.1 Uncharacterised protein [Mycobacteroides abscessus subsp. bolletii]SLD78299.1 Uncharacterised protein [Mycobacteroides abscessus subsp. bolletii]SLD85702.1 Uncharacterised protein [Mycobacteroides abscessus subsp. bolletii]
MSASGERDAIRAAIDRLLAGTPLRSDGALTVVSLAAEANVKRHLLTHRHTDLKDEFYARVRAQGRTPASELAIRQQVAELQTKLDKARAELKELCAANETYARIVNVLTVENEQLKQAVSQRIPHITPIRTNRTQ